MSAVAAAVRLGGSVAAAAKTAAVSAVAVAVGLGGIAVVAEIANYIADDGCRAFTDDNFFI